MSKRFGVLLMVLIWLALAAEATAQTTYTWKSKASNWSSGTAFSPDGTPTAADTVRFLPSGSLPGVQAVNPNISTAAAALSLTVAPNQQLAGWTFTGTGSLTLGGSGSTGLTTYGPQTVTFNGPTLAGASAGNPLALTVTSGSKLVLSGSSAITANQGSVNVNAGTLTLDNSATNIAARLLATGTVTINSGGSLVLIGNAAGTSANVGSLNVGNNTVGGVNTIRVDSNGGLATLNFANSGSFSSRPGTRAVYRYEAASGQLGALAGDSAGTRITFAGTPFLGANGLLATASGGSSLGFATVKDSDGTNFATYTATRGIISVANANSGQTVTTVSTAPTLQALTASSIGQFNPAASGTITATGAVTTGSLRITPAGSGAVLNMSTFALTTNALMLDGANDFTLSGTGVFGSSATRYVYVNDADRKLSTSLVIASGGNATVFAGPGTVELTGAGSQNTLTTTTRFIIAGGVVRGNSTQIGFAASGSPGIVSLSGGVLEIKNGSNGGGASADFTRAVGAAAGNVTWGAGTTNEVGSGGFSAFGTSASVNLGGSATPTALQWGQTNFIGDGYALKFGSTKSDAQLSFMNPINLENGTTYQLREINVTKGVGGDRTVFTGVISGSTAGVADLVKTGTGTLVFTNSNTYTGNTLVQGGTLLAGAAAQSLGDGTGTVIIGSGALVGGDGTGSFVSNSVYAQSGGTIRGGSGTGTLNILKDVTVAGDAANGGIFQTTVSRTAANSADSSRIVLGTDASLDLAPTGGTDKFTINLKNGSGSNAVLAAESYTFVLATKSATGSFKVGGTTLTNATPGTTDIANPNNYTVTSDFGFGTADKYVLKLDENDANKLVLVYSPVPEPGALLSVAAVGLAAVGGLRRLRKRAVASAVR